MNVNQDELAEVISNNEIVVVDFWASWCGPCRIMGPIYSKFAEANPDVAINKIEVDKNDGVAKTYGIKNIPTILFFKNGDVVERLGGVVKQADLQAKLEEVING